MSGFTVYVTPPDVNERNIRTLMYTLSIGWVTADVTGRVTSLPVYLKTPAIKGVTYVLTDKLGEQIEIVVTDNVRTGFVNLPIQAQTIDVLKDEYVLTASSYLNTLLQNDPGRIQESLEQDRNVNDLGRLNETIAQGAIKDTISLSNVTSAFRLLAGQQLILIRNAGITGTNRLRAAQETLQVDVDQDVTPDGNGIASITFVQKTFLHSHDPSLSFLIRPIFAMVGDINAAKEAQDVTDALLDSAKQFGSSLVFEATNQTTVTWGAGTIAIQDGTVYNINSGSFVLPNTNYHYIYYTRTGSALSFTDTLSTAVQTGNILLGTARRGTDANQRAWIVPAVGKLYLSEENLAPNSVKADKIFVNSLSAVSADMGELTAGKITIVSSGNTVWLNPNTTLGLAIGGTTVASAPFRVAYTGAFTATNATVTGTINASGGSITGNLSVTGTLTIGTNGQITGDNYTISKTGILVSGSSAILNSISDPDYILDNNGLRLRGDNPTQLNSASIRWIAGGTLGGALNARIYVLDNAGVSELKIDTAAFVDINPTNGIRIPLNTPSTSSTTGALRITGGIYVGAGSYIDGTVDFNNDVDFRDFTNFRGANILRIYSANNDSYAGFTRATGTASNLTIDIPNILGNATMAFTNRVQSITANQTFNDTTLRLQAVSSGGIATLSYAATANNRTFTIPAVANGTFAFINVGQTWSADQTFGHTRLQIRNTGNNGSATLVYGTASVNRTYTFSGNSGTVLTTGNYTGTLDTVYVKNGIFGEFTVDLIDGGTSFAQSGRLNVTINNAAYAIPLESLG
jgi:hypothetical protein